MKTINKLIFASIVLFFLISCEKDNDSDFNNSENLIGYWINPQFNDTIWSFDKADDFQDNNYGFAFQSGKNFIERKNAGWCGTPPIAYADFTGTWSQNDSLLHITVGYWGGTADYQWKIVSVENNLLKIYKIKEEFHREE